MKSSSSDYHQFELTVLGCSGGPLDKGTCSYLLKPCSVSYNDIVNKQMSNKFICIDGGTGLSGIIDLIFALQRNSVMTENSLLALYSDSLSIEEYTFCETTTPFDLNDNPLSPYQLGMKIMQLLQTYLITHPHADHILGLVVNSPFVLEKTITGTLSTIESLTNNIFNNRIWPELDNIKFKILQDENSWCQMTEDFEIQFFTNSHGSFVENGLTKPYESSAYLVNHIVSGRKLLIFGDVELDSVSQSGKNRVIWNEIAPLIFRDNLLAIMIECSHFDLPSDVPLYGHMSPNYLILELAALRDILLDTFGDYSKLNGLKIIITHVKESITGYDPRKRILKELQDLNKEHRLGLVFTIALPGLTYCL